MIYGFSTPSNGDDQEWQEIILRRDTGADYSGSHSFNSSFEREVDNVSLKECIPILKKASRRVIRPRCAFPGDGYQLRHLSRTVPNKSESKTSTTWSRSYYSHSGYFCICNRALLHFDAF